MTSNIQNSPSSPLPTPSTIKSTENSEDRAESFPSNASSSQSDSSDSDSSDSSNASDSDSDSDSDSERRLRASMKAKAQEKRKEQRFGNERRIRLEGGDEFSTNFPQLDPGKLPPGYFQFGTKSLQEVPSALRDLEAEKLGAASTALGAPAAPLPPPELAKDGKKLTKKERKTQKQKTAGPGWFDLPAPDAADLPRLHREVEALRLRNALDPKRFYRKEEGEGRASRGFLNTSLYVGTIIPTSTPFGTASSDNLTRAERKRTLVDELVDDSEAKRYAKKKFGDLQSVKGAKGRGTLAKRFAARKPKW
ncbi:Fcf2 pre-rRNA processing-domain-containing protein [Phellopilus nigrolimitatus]|nr:Fcf2 pre-rRNA processing-domain-containing protein [Phellopilus nigrolimitatus]